MLPARSDLRQSRLGGFLLALVLLSPIANTNAVETSREEGTPNVIRSAAQRDVNSEETSHLETNIEAFATAVTKKLDARSDIDAIVRDIDAYILTLTAVQRQLTRDDDDYDAHALRRRGLLDAISGPLSAIGDLFGNAAKGIGNALAGGLGGSGFFLGMGIGMGTAEGLNLTTAEDVMTIGNQTAAEFNMDATGLNPAIQNAGVGLTSTLVKALGGTLDTTALLNSLREQAAPAVLALAKGLGSGATQGLNVSRVQVGPPTGGGTLQDVVGSLGFGLSSSLAGTIDLQKIIPAGSLDLNTGDLMAQLPAVAAGLGKGLGSGVPIGLGIQPEQPVASAAPGAPLDAGMLSMNFAQGLSSAFLSNGTLDALTQSLVPSTGQGGLDIDVKSVAGGLARGLLQGIGDGVGSLGGIDAIINGTAKIPTGSIPLTPVQADGTAAEAAVAFGQGLGSQGVAVVQTLLGGDSQAQPQVSIPPPDMTVTTPVSPAGLPPSNSSNTVPPAKRAISTSVEPPTSGLQRRADGVSSVLSGINLTDALSTASITTLAQMGVDSLTCRGLGGVQLLVAGIAESGTIDTGAAAQSNSTTDLVKGLVPAGVIRVINDGYIFEINGQEIRDGLGTTGFTPGESLSINGTKMQTFTVFVVIHVGFAIFALLNVYPLALGLESARNSLIRVGMSGALPKVPRMVNIMWFFLVAPSLIVLFVFGVLVMGTSKHFRTAHGILGIITSLVGVACIALQVVAAIHSRGKTNTEKAAGGLATNEPPLVGSSKLDTSRTWLNQLFLVTILVTSLTGFPDLSSTTLCLTQTVPFEVVIAAGFGLPSLFVLGSALSGFDIFLAWRMRRKARGVQNSSEKKIRILN